MMVRTSDDVAMDVAPGSKYLCLHRQDLSVRVVGFGRAKKCIREVFDAIASNGFDRYSYFSIIPIHGDLAIKRSLRDQRWKQL